MLDEEQAAELVGQTLLDEDEQEVGPVEEVFVLPADDRPAFAAVAVGGRRVVVPLDDAELGEGRVVVRYDRALIEGAPEADADTIDPDLEEAVYGHYGISDASIRDDSGFSATPGEAREQGSSRDPRGGGGADDAAQGHP
jgi:hypothetical protein